MARCVITYRDKALGVEVLAGRRVVSRELGQDAGICAVGAFTPEGRPNGHYFCRRNGYGDRIGCLLTERSA